ncbi:hypothetical protein PM082_019079 [Marasmius tenuissimus]|nr:hypothetical protein PM082_019079 [Marasmius tenuissimus]
MEDLALTKTQLEQLHRCIYNGWLGDVSVEYMVIAISSTSSRTLLINSGPHSRWLSSSLIRLCLDLRERSVTHISSSSLMSLANPPLQVKFLSRSRLSSKLGTGLFVLCRYCALGIAILALTPVCPHKYDSSSSRNSLVQFVHSLTYLPASSSLCYIHSGFRKLAPPICLFLRFTLILASAILAVRTWAIWARNRIILYFLLTSALGAAIGTTIVIGKEMATNQRRPLIIPELAPLCSEVLSDIRFAFVVPYVSTIAYEILTLVLSLYRIAKWRQSIPENIRAPLLDILWRDGVMYFTLMLLLNFMNIGFVLQSEVPTHSHDLELQ